MSLTAVINAFSIPSEARLDQRVPKKLLLEQDFPTVADKRLIQDGIDELFWVAALKPTNIGVPSFRDDVREYLEIAILSVKLRVSAKAPRLVELIHRAIPYPVVLVASQDEAIDLSLAHKRWSQGEIGKVVIEDLRRTAPFKPDELTGDESAFLASLALSSLPGHNLFTLYQGWLDCVSAMEAARQTGEFVRPIFGVKAANLRKSLDELTRIQHNIGLFRAQAEKEKQVSRRVTLNLEIQRMETELAAIVASLKDE
ncbi:protein of unknown function (DUF4391) [Dehalogenimonas alkenigignens]|uniref:DUF4391 domain-containing protein n=1 Tax=Dehalogenimonas alkenigignens TaxID=1217799 RepID=A0A0W0GK67_9CHLR|nr:DUF4391 domain-containing protein [Dehalogenimonas alkenigignens]KTB48969.1 protein of unknown function (DUF4391) [Dehalogenimonas alkenigignens]